MFIVKKDNELMSVEKASQVESMLTLGNKIVVYDEKGQFIRHNAYSYILADIPRVYNRWTEEVTKIGGPAEWVKKEVEKLNTKVYDQ